MAIRWNGGEGGGGGRGGGERGAESANFTFAREMGQFDCRVPIHYRDPYEGPLIISDTVTRFCTTTIKNVCNADRYTQITSIRGSRGFATRKTYESFVLR